VLVLVHLCIFRFLDMGAFMPKQVEIILYVMYFFLIMLCAFVRYCNTVAIIYFNLTMYRRMPLIWPPISIMSSVHTDSVTFTLVIWILLNPPRYYNGFKTSTDE
jgi:hypothetical protein